VGVEPAIGRQGTARHQGGGNEIEPIAVAVITIERALEEANDSLAFSGKNYSILAIMRDDKIK
jgi:hypothetical protein